MTESVALAPQCGIGKKLTICNGAIVMTGMKKMIEKFVHKCLTIKVFAMQDLQTHRSQAGRMDEP